MTSTALMSTHTLGQPFVPARIEGLTHDGRGVARIEGKTVFIAGALPGEQVLFRYTKHCSRFDEGTVAEAVPA